MPSGRKKAFFFNNVPFNDLIKEEIKEKGTFRKETMLNLRRLRRIKNNKIDLGYFSDNDSSFQFMMLKQPPKAKEYTAQESKKRRVERNIVLNLDIKKNLEKSLLYSNKDIQQIFKKEGLVKMFNKNKTKDLSNSKLKALKQSITNKIEHTYLNDVLAQKQGESLERSLKKKTQLFANKKNKGKSSYIMSLLNEEAQASFSLLTSKKPFCLNEGLNVSAIKIDDFFLVKGLLSLVEKALLFYDYTKNYEKKKNHDLNDAKSLFHESNVALLNKDYKYKKAQLKKLGLLRKGPLFYKGPFTIKKEVT